MKRKHILAVPFLVSALACSYNARFGSSNNKVPGHDFVVPIIQADQEVTKQVLDAYKNFDYEKLQNSDWKACRTYYGKIKLPTLHAQQIDQVLETIIVETPKERTQHWTTGAYVSYLIEKSYAAGNNNFVLHTKDAVIDHIGVDIGGTKTEPLRLTIEGNVGARSLLFATYANITVNGNIGEKSVVDANHTSITANGNVGDYCFFSVKNTTGAFYGTVGVNLAVDAENSDLAIYGTVGNKVGLRSKNCTFRTSVAETYEMLQRWAGQPYSMNDLQLVDEKGVLIKSIVLK